MPTVIFQHDVEDREHWLNSEFRARKFSELGATNIRTFVDPSQEKRVAVCADIPDLDRFVEWLESEEGAATAKSDGVIVESIVTLIASGGS